MTVTLVDIHFLNVGTGENVVVCTTIDVDENGHWNAAEFVDGPYSCDCFRSEVMYMKNPLYLLPCNKGLNKIIIARMSLSYKPEVIIYKETIVEEDKQKKIMKEIQDLTPYVAELQEFKERGLFLPEGTTGPQKPQPIFDEQGRRIDKASKEKRKTNAEQRAELNAKALKIRILAINKWLDENFSALLPKWVLKIIRKWPWTRPYILKLFFVKVSIVRNRRPVPFGSDVVTITCFFSKYAEVNFVWEK